MYVAFKVGIFNGAIGNSGNGNQKWKWKTETVKFDAMNLSGQSINQWSRPSNIHAKSTVKSKNML